MVAQDSYLVQLELARLLRRTSTVASRDCDTVLDSTESMQHDLGIDSLMPTGMSALCDLASCSS